jgi:DNA-binding GntR family transcriptional regulator
MSAKWTSTSTPYLLPRRAGEVDAWTQEAGPRGTQRLIEVAAKVPPAEVANSLGLIAGETAVARRRVMLLDGQPVELTDSYYPQAIAAGTALAEHAKIRGGAPTLLRNLGHEAHRVAEEVEARSTTPDEAAALDLEPGTAVLTLLRVTYSRSEQPIEASLMVMKGPHRLRYEMEIG